MHKGKLKILLPPEKQWSFLLAVIFHRNSVSCNVFSYHDQEYFGLLPHLRMFVLLEKKNNQIRSNILCRSQTCKVTEFSGTLEGMEEWNQYVFISVDETR